MPPTTDIPTRPHDPYAALRHANYRFYALGNFISIIGDQMLSTAVNWELWQRTHSAMALGLWGLILAIPFMAMAIPAGHLADRYNRRFLVILSEVLLSFCALGFAWVSLHHAELSPGKWAISFNHILERLAGSLEKYSIPIQGPSVAGYSFNDLSVPVIYLLLFIIGIFNSLNIPAKNSLLPQLVPLSDFPNAVTWGSQTWQIGSIIGPPIAGAVIATFGIPAAYLGAAICGITFLIVLLFVKDTQSPAAREPITLKSLSAGIRFVWQTKIILATITLDLFAVFVGGVTALLPMFATKILHVGVWGFSWLRVASSIGAVCMAMFLTHRPPMEKAGRDLLWAVTGFGVATIVFGLSQSFWLSFAMLFLTGALDNISVVVRATLVQVLTPDAMRGRVSAVHFMFIVGSNELGGAESGLTAALFGPVLSTVGGGIGTILVVLGVAYLWPQVAKLESLASVKTHRVRG